MSEAVWRGEESAPQELADEFDQASSETLRLPYVEAIEIVRISMSVANRNLVVRALRALDDAGTVNNALVEAVARAARAESRLSYALAERNALREAPGPPLTAEEFSAALSEDYQGEPLPEIDETLHTPELIAELQQRALAPRPVIDKTRRLADKNDGRGEDRITGEIVT